jgi:hypothetical protein
VIGNLHWPSHWSLTGSFCERCWLRRRNRDVVELLCLILDIMDMMKDMMMDIMSMRRTLKAIFILEKIFKI